jgi:putative ABC transport system permease protein
MTVTGVIKDPLNTHLKFETLESASTYESQRPGESPRFWIQQVRPIYIKLSKNADREVVESKIQNAFIQLWKVAAPDRNFEPRIFLSTLKDVYFSDTDPGIPYMKRGNRNVVFNFFLLGLAILMLGIINYVNLTMARAAILMLGIINYVNLTMARAALRRKEIVLRKIVGSSRFKLILYFLTESIITTFLSFLVALTILQLLFQTFNRLLQADINPYFLNYPAAWILGLIVILFVGILSGVYPAIRLSSGNPVVAISGDSRRSFGGLLTRRMLMTIQFTSAVILMISILVMHIQIRDMKEQDLGFNAERIVWTKKSIGGMSVEHKRLLLSRLERYPNIEKACFSNKVPGDLVENFEPINNPESELHGMHMDHFQANPEFFEVYGLKLTHGSEILDHIPLDKSSGDNTFRDSIRYAIVNETFLKKYKQEDPTNLPLGDRWSTVGVVQDFHYRSHQYSMYPLFIHLTSTGTGHYLSVRINSSDIHNTLRKIDNEINEVQSLKETSRSFIKVPSRKFNFIDETINRQYEHVDRIHDASIYLFIMAMIIACLGLFGLSTFMVQRRIKETGIRKTLGATDMQLFMLLSWDLIRWVLLSVIIGCPIGWLIMNKWQQQFAYKADTGAWIYLAVAIIAFGIAFLTSGWQAIKTAQTNPVDSLRYE